MFVMAKEPVPNMSVADIRAYFSDKYTENDLADAYAIAHNQFWWIEDNEYDFEMDSPDYKAACAITDEWCSLMNEYKNRIFEILLNKGVAIPETGQTQVLELFMTRFGYVDGNGWWVKSQATAE